MTVIPLSSFGLISVEDAARRRNCDPSTVRRWASRGEIPVVVVGSGRSAKFLLRIADVESFVPGTVGAPKGNANAKKEPAPKPTKTRARKESGKKSRKA